MGLASAWRAWKEGKGLDQAFGYLYLTEADIQAGIDATNKLDELNRQAFERGIWTEEQYAQVQARNQSSTIPAMLDDPATSIWGGFKTGLGEGAANMQSAVKHTLAAPLNWTFGAIPWQVWALLVVVVAWKLGWIQRYARAR